MESEARPERPFGGGGLLLFPRRRPRQICHLWRVRCSPESRRVFPELATVVAVAAPVHGVLDSPPTCGEELLVKISGSLQVGSSPSAAISVGVVEEGWRPAVTAAWRRLEAVFVQRQDPGACVGWLLRQLNKVGRRRCFGVRCVWWC